jgi:hypothetical protein
MPASLSEAFGQDYDSYPLNDSQLKRRKKPHKVKTYGQQVQNPRFTATEPQKQLNINLQAYPHEDDQYLSITNEYGPTDYNIKPIDVQEYAFQVNNNYTDKDNNINKNIINHKLNQNLNQNLKDENILDDTDNEDDNNSFQQNPSPNPSLNPNELDPRIVEFNSKLDLILQKLGHFDEPTQENIHDIILFVIFGCFVIFILDSVYRVGKMTF